MSQNRPGPAGGISIIKPVDLDEASSKLKPPVEPVKKAPKEPLGSHRFNQNQKQLRPPKPPKPKLEETLAPWVMAFKPEKKFSIAYIKWWLYTRLRLMRFEFISPPSTTVGAWKEIRANIKYLIDHRDEISAVVAVLSAKGGAAKSTIIQWLAAFMGYYVKLKPALLGMDVGADKTVSRFAADEEKVFPVSLLNTLVKQGVAFSADWLLTQTQTDAESGLVLFKAKPKTSPLRDYNIEETTNMMRYMHKLYPLTFGDTGPGTVMKAAEGAALAADVTLISNKGLSVEVLNDIQATIDLKNYDLKSKKISPIVVIGGVLPRMLNTRTQYEIVAAKCGVDPKNVILLPYDRYLDDQKRFNLKRVHIPALSTRSTLMLSRLAKRVVEVIVETKSTPTRSPEEAVMQLIPVTTPEQRTQNVY